VCVCVCVCDKERFCVRIKKGSRGQGLAESSV